MIGFFKDEAFSFINTYWKKQATIYSSQTVPVMDSLTAVYSSLFLIALIVALFAIQPLTT